MPELPEVETIRRQLAPGLLGREVVGAWAFPSPKFDEAPAAIGATVTGLRRRGKYLLADLERDGRAEELIVHLGMTGRLAIDGGAVPGDIDGGAVPGDSHGGDEPHLRAAWLLDDGRRLSFTDVRRFGRVAVVEAGDHDRLPTLAALGPEPFDESFTPESLRRAVNGAHRHVKTHLLSQRVVAGVGNIYADESLWRSGVHPCARRLTRTRAAALRDAVRATLAEGIAHGGTTLRDYRDALGGEGSHQDALDCYGRAGEPCSRCGVLLRHTVVDARSTTFCPSCQRR
jgi:formamidopyrimidine-DNA glycosylase